MLNNRSSKNIRREKRKDFSVCKCSGLEIVMIFSLWRARATIVHRKPMVVSRISSSFFGFSPLSSSPHHTRPLCAAPNEKNKRNYEPTATDVTSDYTQLSTPLGIIHPTCINSLRRLTLRSLPPVSVSTFFTAWKWRAAPFTFVRSFERLIL